MGDGVASHDLARHHVQVADTPDLLPEPARFAGKPLPLRALQDWLEDRECASEPPQTDAKLMRALRVIELQHHSDILGDLVDAFAQYVACCRLGRLLRLQKDRLGAARCERRLDVPFLRQQIAARCLGKPGKSQTALWKQRS